MVLNRKLYPLVLIDIALFTIEDDALKVLLVKRALEPEVGQWALPGGILRPETDQSLEGAARRVLRDKVTVDIAHLKEVQTFSGPDRDPRGWSVAVLFYALLPRDQIDAVIRSKVEAVQWVDATKPGHKLAFDHQQQLGSALTVLKEKVHDHELPLHLMPPLFTLTALQRTCEAILGRPLDKGVFRRKLADSPDLVETGEYVRGPQRPAQLFRARDGFRF